MMQRYDDFYNKYVAKSIDNNNDFTNALIDTCNDFLEQGVHYGVIMSWVVTLMCQTKDRNILDDFLFSALSNQVDILINSKTIDLTIEWMTKIATNISEDDIIKIKNIKNRTLLDIIVSSNFVSFIKSKGAVNNDSLKRFVVAVSIIQEHSPIQNLINIDVSNICENFSIEKETAMIAYGEWISLFN